MGYIAALLGQIVTALALVLLMRVLPAFTFADLLLLLTVALTALNWGTGPSLVATLVGALLLDIFVVPPLFSWAHRKAEGLIDVLLFLAVGVVVSIAASRTAQARRDAKAAVQMRDEILSIAIHDLRSPLTKIIGRVEMVQHRLRQVRAARTGETLDTVWLEAQMEALESSARQMPATIDEMSDVACLQMGQTLDLSCEDIDVRALVQMVAEEYITAAGAPPVHVDAPTTGIAHGDRARLRRVLQNVIDNAIKYSPQDAPVQVMVRVDDAGVMMSIRDHGLGIPAADLPYIFTRFYRGSTAKGVRGTGIGLASAKVIVEQHGGQIHVESEPGRGTTVTVCLPLMRRPE
jgi:signal transduction histidine kinase